MEGGKADKQIVKVGHTNDPTSTVGETVSFTAEVFGRVAADGGVDGGGLDYVFYRLPDGNFRVLVEKKGFALLLPSNMVEAINNDQPNNYSYGRMSSEELKAYDDFQVGEMYERLLDHHPETVRNRVRDLD